VQTPARAMRRSQGQVLRGERCPTWPPFAKAARRLQGEDRTPMIDKMAPLTQFARKEEYQGTTP
jgi:hypothetical protein